MGIFYELMVGFGFGWAQLAGFSGVGQVFAELSCRSVLSMQSTEALHVPPGASLPIAAG